MDARYQIKHVITELPAFGKYHTGEMSSKQLVFQQLLKFYLQIEHKNRLHFQKTGGVSNGEIHHKCPSWTCTCACPQRKFPTVQHGVWSQLDVLFSLLFGFIQLHITFIPNRLSYASILISRNILGCISISHINVLGQCNYTKVTKVNLCSWL